MDMTDRLFKENILLHVKTHALFYLDKFKTVMLLIQQNIIHAHSSLSTTPMI